MCDCVLVRARLGVRPPKSPIRTQTLNFGGGLFPDPIRCCQSHKLNTLFILSLSLPLSLLVTLPLSDTYSTASLYLEGLLLFFSPSLSSDLSVERERHLVSSWRTEHSPKLEYKDHKVEGDCLADGDINRDEFTHTHTHTAFRSNSRTMTVIVNSGQDVFKTRFRSHTHAASPSYSLHSPPPHSLYVYLAIYINSQFLLHYCFAPPPPLLFSSL